MENNLFPSLHALKGAPAGILLALLVQPGPLGVAELAERTGWSPATVSQSLRRLAALGLASNRSRYRGWSLTGEARRLFAPGIWGPISSDGVRAAGKAGSAPLTFDHPCEREKTALEGEIFALPESLSLREEESSSIKTFKDSSSDSQTGARQARQPLAPDEARRAVAGLLDASESLFGEPVLGPPERYPDPDVLLAAMAEAYDRRALLRKPARVVFGMLKHGYTPGACYREDPQRYLPPEFLAAAGLRAPDLPTELEEDDETEQDPEPAQDRPPKPEPHPSLAAQAGEHPGRTAAEAWRMARAALETLLPRHVFVARFAPLRLLRYDPQANAFTLAAPDLAQRDWLADRLGTALERALLGACNRAAVVRFVVDEDEGRKTMDNG